MDVLVISDSHGTTNNIYAVLEREKHIRTCFFLGDGLSDIEKISLWFPGHNFICVKGNNDFYSDEDPTAYQHIEGNTIVATHGHYFSVRQTKAELISHAKGVLANVVFFGHTHRALDYTDPVSEIRLINPGAMCDGKYAVVSLEKDKIEVKLLRL